MKIYLWEGVPIEELERPALEQAFRELADIHLQQEAQLLRERAPAGYNRIINMDRTNG